VVLAIVDQRETVAVLLFVSTNEHAAHSETVIATWRVLVRALTV